VERPAIRRTESQIFAQLGASEKELRTYSGLLHEIFNEPERENVSEDLLEWACGLKG
jgi:alpha-beta hydrolase superfamily lysophospholipase